MPGRSDRSTTKIFVGNLPDRYPDNDLRELFEQYGEVAECDVIKNFAFVHFVNENEAEEAVKGLNGSEIKGKNIRVEISEKSRGGRGDGHSRGTSGGRTEGGSTKLFVGNLPDGYPDNALRELFEQYGEVTECDVLKNFGFVHFKTAEEAELAKDGLVNHSIDGKKIRVESSGSGRGGGGTTGTKLFVGNLPDNFPPGELRAMFEKYGKVVECDIIKHFAFVHFDNPRDATTAKDALNNVRIKDRNIRVQVSNTGVRPKAGMGDSDGCFTCGERGHWSKECPNQGRGGRGGGGGGGKDRDTCNRCGETGHWARDCPKPSDWRPRDSGRDSRDGRRSGFNDRNDRNGGRADFGTRSGFATSAMGGASLGVGPRDNVSAMAGLGARGLGGQLGAGLAGTMGAPMGGPMASAGAPMGAAPMGGGMGLNMGGGMSGRDPFAPVRDPYGAPRPDPYAVPQRDPYGPPREQAFGMPQQRDPYGLPPRDLQAGGVAAQTRDAFRAATDPFARDAGYPQMRDRSPLRAPPSSLPSDPYFRRTPPRSLAPPKEDPYGRMTGGRDIYGQSAMDDRGYAGTEAMGQFPSSLGGAGAGAGLPTRSIEADRYAGQMTHEDMSMGNGAARGAVGYPPAVGGPADRGIGFGAHLPLAGDRGFGAPAFGGAFGR